MLLPAPAPLPLQAIDPGLLLGALPFYFDLEQRSDWTCLYNLVYAHLLALRALAPPAGEAVGEGGGKAYFITDEEETNNAAWGVFRPALQALGIRVHPLIKIPGPVLLASAFSMEGPPATTQCYSAECMQLTIHNAHSPSID